jgi:lipopolysaccharide biosynthesis glycosyltransferase
MLAGTDKCLGIDTIAWAAPPISLVDCHSTPSLLGAVATSICGAVGDEHTETEMAIARLKRWSLSERDFVWVRLFDKNWQMAMEVTGQNAKKSEGADWKEPVEQGDHHDALVVLANDGFVFGLLVFIHSFLVHNKASFVGDIVILHSLTKVQLSDTNRAIIKAAFAEYVENEPVEDGRASTDEDTTRAKGSGSGRSSRRIRIVFRLVDEAPYSWAASVLSSRALERGMDRSAFKYEIFEMSRDYRRVVYMDCDMLVTGSLSELFDARHPFAVVSHDPLITQPEGTEVRTDDTRLAGGHCFNGGLLSIGRQLRHPMLRIRDRLLLILRESRGIVFKDPGCGTTAMCDQGLLNSLFRAAAPSWLFLPLKFNYPKRKFPRVSAECNLCYSAYWNDGQMLLEGRGKEGQVGGSGVHGGPKGLERSGGGGSGGSGSGKMTEADRRVVEQECHMETEGRQLKDEDVRAVHFTSGKPWTEGFGDSGLLAPHSWSGYWGDDAFTCFAHWHRSLAELRHSLQLDHARPDRKSSSPSTKQLELRTKAAVLLLEKTAAAGSCPVNKPSRKEAQAAHFELLCIQSGKTPAARCHSQCAWVAAWQEGWWATAIWQQLLWPAVTWHSLQLWLAGKGYCSGGGSA